MRPLILLTSAIPLCLLSLSRADNINWGSEFGSVNLQSDGTTAVNSSFTVQLGAFDAGFTPTGANVDLWAANWTPLNELLPGEHHLVPGYYTRSGSLDDNTTFAAGTQAYVWMYNSNTAVPGSEWLLYTNDDTDGSALDDWLFPQVTGSKDPVTLSWRVSNASRVLFGALDPNRSDTTPGKFGDGYGTNPTGAFNVQTHTFVPEPSAWLTSMAGLLILARRRRAVSGD